MYIINYCVHKFRRGTSDHILSTFLRDIQPLWAEILVQLSCAHLDDQNKSALLGLKQDQLLFGE